MILLFGASQGIGLALARLLVAAGEEVTMLARNSGPLQEAAAELGCRWTVCDARQFAEVDAVFADMPDVTGAVNCAGSLLLKPAHLTSEAELHDTWEQNVKSSFAVVRGAGRVMKSGGSVVLFSSCAARIGLPNHEAIAACKAAVQGLALSASATYAARGLRFNVVAPGLVDTPLAARITSRPASRQASEAQHPLGRLGSAEEVASLAQWLLSAQAGWVTGQVFGVDGGLSTVKAASSPPRP